MLFRRCFDCSELLVEFLCSFYLTPALRFVSILALGQELLTVLNVTFLILQVSSPARKPSFIIFSAQLFINFSINIYIDGELFGILSIKKTIDFTNSPINPLSTNPTICRQTVWMCLTKCHKLTVASIMY